MFSCENCLHHRKPTAPYNSPSCSNPCAKEYFFWSKRSEHIEYTLKLYNYWYVLVSLKVNEIELVLRGLNSRHLSVHNNNRLEITTKRKYYGEISERIAECLKSLELPRSYLLILNEAIKRLKKFQNATEQDPYLCPHFEEL